MMRIRIMQTACVWLRTVLLCGVGRKERVMGNLHLIIFGIIRFFVLYLQHMPIRVFRASICLLGERNKYITTECYYPGTLLYLGIDLSGLEEKDVIDDFIL